VVATCARAAQIVEKGAALKSAAPASVAGWAAAAETVAKLSSDLGRVCQQYGPATFNDPNALAGVVGDFDSQHLGPLHQAFAKLAAILPNGQHLVDAHAGDPMTEPDPSSEASTGSGASVAPPPTPLASAMHTLDTEFVNAIATAHRATSREGACAPVSHLVTLARALNAPGMKAPSAYNWQIKLADVVQRFDDIATHTCNVDSGDDASVVAERLERIQEPFDQLKKLTGV